jgi:Cu(I)/Ag(I) efflux system membrane protein CusA/SilA
VPPTRPNFSFSGFADRGKMINKIIDFSVRNRIIIFALTAAACLAGWWSMRNMALDSIPDISDTQVIIYSRWDRSPEIIEDQVTYPIVTTMTGAPNVRSVRGFSDFGYSFVYVIFEDDTDIYWARSRTQEYLASVLPRLPEGVRTELGPDASSLGWVFQYALVDHSGKYSLADLRAWQDWYLRFHLKSVPGVAEVAPIGGFSKQYQVNVDPNRLQAYGISINRVVEAVRGGNRETGGRLIDFGGSEYMIRGHGYSRSLQDFENIVLTATDNGTPVRIRDIGQVALGPELRRGVADLDGAGEVVSGIIVMRHGQNALEVIDRVKKKIREIEPGLPKGVSILPVYDRSDLIRRSIDNLKSTITEIILIVVFIIILFLRHIPSALTPVITIPVAVLLSFIPFRMLGITANVMSLAGIAIAIGALVDAAIVVVEQTHKGLEDWEKGGRRKEPREVVIAAVRQVAGPSFLALLLIGVSFLPVLTLEAQEGRLFKPLAYTKTFAIVIAAFLAITLDPALRISLTRMNPVTVRPRCLNRIWSAIFNPSIQAEENNRISSSLVRVYEPVVNWTLQHKWLVITGALIMMMATVPVFLKLGSEYMPPFEEGSLLYMPTTPPGISIAEAKKLLEASDQIIRGFPEVERVLGKAGRAESATDPAPLSMLETLIILKPKEQWPHIETWYSGWSPNWLKSFFRLFTPDHLSQDELIHRMNEALQFPGVANAWTMPIKGRIEMLSTGLKTPVGLKVTGPDLETIEKIGTQAESVLKGIRGTRGVFSEKTARGYFLDLDWDREALSRYGLSIDEVQETVARSIGGENVTTTVEGRERYSVNVRFMRDFRSDPDIIGRVLVPAAGGKIQIPLSQLALISTKTGPSMIRNEDGLLTGYVYIDVAGRDENGFITEAGRILKEKLSLPAGCALSWSGQYEAVNRMQNRLKTVIPMTILMITILLYANTRSLIRTAIVLLSVPFSAIGAFWFLYLLGYNMSTGVWIGLIALLGVDAETGIFMLLYLDLACEKARRHGHLRNIEDIRTAVKYGAAQRLRPKVMTVAAMFFGLVPIMWSNGAGSDIMKHIAAPMIGGIATSFFLELLIYPVIYQSLREYLERRKNSALTPEYPAYAEG